MTDRTDPTPAALYARVSSDRQDVDLSISAQLRALRDYAEKNNYLIVREYVDEAESGRVADRPQFRRMLDEASADDAPFEEILVWKFSRFTRKREHAVAFESMLRRRGIRVTSITEHADDSPTGKLMEAIIESVDEFYSENPAQEVARGMREAASRGFWVASRTPYGYRKVHVQNGAEKRPGLELDPDAAPGVQRKLGMAESGKGIADIAFPATTASPARPGGLGRRTENGHDPFGRTELMQARSTGCSAGGRSPSPASCVQLRNNSLHTAHVERRLVSLGVVQAREFHVQETRRLNEASREVCRREGPRRIRTSRYSTTSRASGKSRQQSGSGLWLGCRRRGADTAWK